MIQFRETEFPDKTKKEQSIAFIVANGVSPPRRPLRLLWQIFWRMGLHAAGAAAGRLSVGGCMGSRKRSHSAVSACISGFPAAICPAASADRLERTNGRHVPVSVCLPAVPVQTDGCAPAAVRRRIHAVIRRRQSVSGLFFR